ncbi:MAG: phosphate ABC transporter substrate-binding protein [candidate division WOR-3 bacterium]|nr:phosphate ABC transporter substrate-binding protein [candidate division WOR-3 bacterium]
MKKLLVLSILLSLGFTQSLNIQGSTTVLPIAQAAAEAYMEKHPDADIMVRGGGSGTGIAALIDRATDIATSSRPIKTKELKQARERGVNPVGTVIALDGIAVIVHPNNPINDISIADLKKIYTGKITSWNALGGKGNIVVVSRDAASGTFEVFNEKVLGGTKMTEGALMLASNLEVARAVEQTPGAIGYVGLGYLSEKVKVLKVNGVNPSEETVRNGYYPLARALYMYTNGNPAGLTKSFIDFILSGEGQKIVRDNGFVPVK